MKDYVITNCTIVLTDSLLEKHSVEVKNGKIYRIHYDKNLKKPGLPVIDGQKGYLTPGLVEMHIHGCGPYCTGQPEDHVISDMKAFLKDRGINTFLPTMQYDPPTFRRTVKELNRMNPPKHEIPGIYLEGPFISPEKRGGIQVHNITGGDLSLLKDIIRASENRLAMMTLAPECRNFSQLEELLNQDNIICALGHSNCDISKISLPGDSGRLNITHLFNAMSPLSHKTPGLASLPFLDNNIFYEINADGVHIHPEMVRMCLKQLNLQKGILISDAVISAGSAPGEYEYMSEPVISGETGVRKKHDNVLVGSNTLVNTQVKILIQQYNMPIEKAFSMVTVNPLKLLGLSEIKGTVEEGKSADLILWDKHFNLIKNLY